MCCRGLICCLDMLKSEPTSDSESDNFYDRRGSSNPTEPITTTRNNSQTLRQNLAPSDDQFKAATSGTNVKVEIHENVVRIIGHCDTATASQDLEDKHCETVLGDKTDNYQLNAINPNDKSSCSNLFDTCNANSCLSESDGILCEELKAIDVANMVAGVVHDKQQNAVVLKDQAISTHFFDIYETNNYVNGSEVYHPLSLCCKHDTSINSNTIVNDMRSPIKRMEAPEEEYIGPKSDKNDNAKTTEFSELEVDKSVSKVLYAGDAVIKKSVIEVKGCGINAPVLDEDLHASAIQETEVDCTKIDDLHIPWIDDPKALNISLTKSYNGQKITIQSNLDKNNVPPTDSSCIELIKSSFASDNNTNPFMVNTLTDLAVTFPLKDISNFTSKSKGTASSNPFEIDNCINDIYVSTSFVDLVAKDVVNISHNVTDPSRQCTSTSLINTNKADNNPNDSDLVGAHMDLLPYDVAITDNGTTYCKINAVDPNNIDVCELLIDISEFDNNFNENCISAQHTNAYEPSEVACVGLESDIKDGFCASESYELPIICQVDDTSEIATELNSLKEPDNSIPWIDETIQIEFIAEESFTTLDVGICSHSDKNKELNIHCNENLELNNPSSGTCSFVVNAEQHKAENILLKDIPMLPDSPCSHDQGTYAGLINIHGSVDCITENVITTGYSNVAVKNVENVFNKPVGCSILNPVSANKRNITTKLIDVPYTDNYLNESSKPHILKSTVSDMIDFSSPVKSINAYKVTCVTPISETKNNSDSAEFCELITENFITEVTDTCTIKGLIHIKCTSEEELHLPASTILKDTIKNVQINNLSNLSIGDIEPINSSALEKYISQEDRIHSQSKKNENSDKESSFPNSPLHTNPTVVNTQQPIKANYGLQDVYIENEIKLIDNESTTATNLEDINVIPYID